MNIDEAVARACEEPTLTKALSWIAIWESERAIAQAIEWKRTGTSTASHGGGWDTCFEYHFERVMEAWKKKPSKLTSEARTCLLSMSRIERMMMLVPWRKQLIITDEELLELMAAPEPPEPAAGIFGVRCDELAVPTPVAFASRGPYR